jgi:hypothetical protein
VSRRLAAAERLASLGSVAALYALFGLYGLGPANVTVHVLVVACALSLVHPGLGPTALLAYLSSSLALGGGIWLVLALALMLPAAVAIRYWPQAALWLAAILAAYRADAVSYIALAALVYSLRRATPSSAAALMAFYALAVNVKLAVSLPPGAVGCGGLVVAAALREAGRQPLELVSDWFYSNFLGPPHLFFQMLVYAIGGAATVKGSQSFGRAAAPLSAAAISLAHYAIAVKVGLIPDPAALAVVPLATALLAVAPRSLQLRRAPPQVPPPPPLLEHLSSAWIALYRLVKRGERLLLVFGPRGCGKTVLIAEVCAASGLELARDGDCRGKVVHVENAESVTDLEKCVERALRMGARCVVLETSRPAAVAQKLQGLPLRKAVYVPPPDQAARARILRLLLGARLGSRQLAELAEATEGFSLRALIRLAEYIREGHAIEDALRAASELQLSGTTPLLTVEELREIENFTSSFKGLVMGFAS